MQKDFFRNFHTPQKGHIIHYFIVVFVKKCKKDFQYLTKVRRNIIRYEEIQIKKKNIILKLLIIALVRSVRSFMVTADPDYLLTGRLAFHHLFLFFPLHLILYFFCWVYSLILLVKILVD